MNIRQEIKKILATHTENKVFNNIETVKCGCYELRHDIEDLMRRACEESILNVETKLDEIKYALGDVFEEFKLLKGD